MNQTFLSSQNTTPEFRPGYSLPTICEREPARACSDRPLRLRYGDLGKLSPKSNHAANVRQVEFRLLQSELALKFQRSADRGISIIEGRTGAWCRYDGHPAR